MKQDVYQKVTDKIVVDLEKDELTWLKPWSAGNMDGRVLKPLRHNGVAYTPDSAWVTQQARNTLMWCSKQGIEPSFLSAAARLQRSQPRAT